VVSEGSTLSSARREKLVSGDEGPEDSAPESNLEAILEAWASKEHANALLSGDPKAYFIKSIQEVAQEFRVPHSAYHNVLNFVSNRAGYHVSKGKQGLDLKREVLHDAYQYLLELHNDFGLVENNLPRFHRHWR
jgi:hypothetical protein